MALTGCSLLLEDVGPLPPRYSGPPVAADTVVTDLTSAFAAEGVTLKRTPQDLVPSECHESLTGEHESATVEATLKAGFARARSDHGWQTGPDLASGPLSLSKGNWIAATTLPGAATEDYPTTAFVITLVCVGGLSESSSPTASPTESPTTSPSGAGAQRDLLKAP